MVKAALAVNQELILLYWQIGQDILTRQQTEGWGAKLIKRLAKDPKREFPDMRAFSHLDIIYTRAFAEIYPKEATVQQAAGQIPGGHNLKIIEMIKDPKIARDGAFHCLG